MPTLNFAVQADFEKVIRLKNEINRLETELKKLGSNAAPEAVKKLETRLAECRNEMAGLVASAAKAGSAIDKESNLMANAMKKVGTAVAGAFAFQQVQQFVTQVAMVRGEFQKLDVAFNTMLGSKERADALMAQLIQTAATTPFQMSEVANSAKQLLAYGVEAEKVNETMIRLGDIAAGLSLPISDLAFLYGTTMVQGRMYTQDLNQFLGRGIPLAKELAKQFGVAEKDVKKLVEEGKVGFPQVEKAITALTNKGGQFGGLMAAQSKTISGQISNLGDAVEQMMNNIGKANEGAISTSINFAKTLIENYETVGKILLDLVAVYGAYRAAMIATAAGCTKLTLAENLHYAALIVQQGATKALTAAQALLNKTILSNPYVAATTAIVALGAAMIHLANRESDAEKTQNRLNNTMRKAEVSAASEISQLSRLRGQLEATTRGTKEYNDIKQQIIDQFGKYNSNLTTEIESVEQAANAYEKLSESIRGAALSRGYENAVKGEYEEMQKNLNEVLKNTQEKLYKEFNKDEAKASRIYTKIFNALAEGSVKLKAGFGGMYLNGFDKETSKAIKDAGLTDYIKTYINQKLTSDKELKKIEERYKPNKPFEEQQEVVITGQRRNKAYYEEQKKEAQSQYDAMTLTEKNTAKGKALASKIADLDKKIQSYSVSSQQKAAKTAENLRQKQEEATQKAQDQLTALNRANKEADIENEKDFSLKRLAQMQNDWEKRKEEINKQKREFEELNEKAGKGKSLTAEQDAAIKEAYKQNDNALQRQKDDIAEEERNAMRDYLKEYGKYQQKKLAITQEYAEKIKKATTEGDKLKLGKERDNLLSDIDIEEFKKGINWEALFGSLKSMTAQELSNMRSMLETYRKTKEYTKLSVKDKKEIEDAYKNLIQAQTNTGNIFDQLSSATKAYNDALNELSGVQAEYNKVMSEGTDEEKKSAIQKLANAQKKVVETRGNKDVVEKSAISKLQTLSSVITDLGNASELSLSGLGRLTATATSAFSEAAGKVGGIIGAILGILDSIGDRDVDEWTRDMASKVFSAVGSALDSKYSVLHYLAPSGMLGSSNKQLEEELERLTKSNEALRQSIESLSEKMDKGAVADASNIYETQKRNLEQMIANTQKQIADSAATYNNGVFGIGGKHSSNSYVNEGLTQNWIEISRIVGREVKSANELWNLTSEQMAKLAEENTVLYSKIKDLASQGYKDAGQYLDQYIEYYQQLEELENKYREKLTNTSFDSVVDGFKSALMNMESDSQDFATNFEKMMKEAVFNSLMSGQYKKKLEDWYKKFSQKMEDGSLSRNEETLLRDEYYNIVDEVKAERDKIYSMMGWGQDYGEQQASSKGFASMSQETGEELSGRFAAVHEACVEQNITLTNISVKLDTITAESQGLRDIANDSRDIMAQSLLELQSIRENTEEVIKPIKQIAEKITKVEQNTSKL